MLLFVQYSIELEKMICLINENYYYPHWIHLLWGWCLADDNASIWISHFYAYCILHYWTPFEFGTNERITYGGIETMQTLHRILFYVHFSAIWYLLKYLHNEWIIFKVSFVKKAICTIYRSKCWLVPIVFLPLSVFSLNK